MARFESFFPDYPPRAGDVMTLAVYEAWKEHDPIAVTSLAWIELPNGKKQQAWAYEAERNG